MPDKPTPDRPDGMNPSRYAAVLSSAMKEFATLGYARASMAEIASSAGVSKALLFHYFGSKSGLFDHAYRVGMASLFSALDEAAPRPDDDLFAAFTRMLKAKAEVCVLEPSLTLFMAKAWYETDPEVAETLRSVNRPLEVDQRQRLIALAESTPLRPGISPEMAIDLLLWAADGFLRDRLSSQPDSLEDIEENFSPYLSVLRAAVIQESL